MKSLIFLLLLGIQEAAAVTHSLKYFYTGSSQVSNFPEFVAVAMVDEVQVFHYDSDTQKAEPKQDWMNKLTADDPKYWERQTENLVGHQQVFKADTKILKQRFNQTGGVHIFQWMYGCEWDDETNNVTGFHQFGYDGEDFITFDLETQTWIAPKQQAVLTKMKWNSNRPYNVHWSNYHKQLCPDWLKKYVNYGSSSLQRTVLPSVSLLQKNSSFPVSCHATGFYPDRAMMFWRKDGEELHEGVEKGEILPNNDGTFQMTVNLDLRSVAAEDWRRYDCLFQLSGVNEDIVTKLDKAVIRTNEASAADPISPIILIAIAAVVLVFVALIGFIIYKKKSAKSSQPYKKTPPEMYPTRATSLLDSTSSTDGSTESLTSTTQLIQKKETDELTSLHEDSASLNS